MSSTHPLFFLPPPILYKIGEYSTQEDYSPFVALSLLNKQMYQKMQSVQKYALDVLLKIINPQEEKIFSEFAFILREKIKRDPGLNQDLKQIAASLKPSKPLLLNSCKLRKDLIFPLFPNIYPDSVLNILK